MFSCEYCETFKNSFFYRTPPVATFGYTLSTTAQQMKFTVKDFIFTKDIVNGKLDLLCSAHDTKTNQFPSTKHLRIY